MTAFSQQYYFGEECTWGWYLPCCACSMFSLDPDTQVMFVLTSRLFLMLQVPVAVWS